MQTVRRTSVAGTWYPGDAPRLVAEMEQYLGRVAPLDHLPRSVRAVVAPHAGLMYSGPVAAYSYKVAGRGRYDAVVLVGPSHFVPFPGASVWPRGGWETPLQTVAVDEPLAQAIMTEWTEIIDFPSAHGREHSLEMQLPFVAHVLGGVTIVPIVMGQQTRRAAFALGGAIARGVSACGGEVLLVASSDLSHYEPADQAELLDRQVIRRVEALDPYGLMQQLELEPRHACGGGPMVAVLEAARQLGATEARLLDYADSGDVSGDKSSVVGYMAAAIW